MKFGTSVIVGLMSTASTVHSFSVFNSYYSCGQIKIEANTTCKELFKADHKLHQVTHCYQTRNDEYFTNDGCKHRGQVWTKKHLQPGLTCEKRCYEESLFRTRPKDHSQARPSNYEDISVEKKREIREENVRYFNVSKPDSVDNKILSKQEDEWIKKKDEKMEPYWRDYFDNVGLESFDYNDYKNKRKPRVGVAVSGGGHRAMYLGMGFLNALDSRNELAKTKKTGGLFQVTSYLSSLSGGSWFVAALLASDYPLPRDYTDANKDNLAKHLAKHYWSERAKILKNLELLKEKEKFEDTTLVEIWGKTIAYQILNGTDPKLSDFAKNPDTAFSQHEGPFPVIIASELFKQRAYSTAELWEFNPFECGSFERNISAFVKTERFGSKFDKNNDENNIVVENNDELSFIYGMSSDAYSFPEDYSLEKKAPTVDRLLGGAASLIGRKAGYTHLKSYIRDFTLGNTLNPFKGIDNNATSVNDDDVLHFGDTGFGDQGSLSLHNLLLPERNIDILFSIDGSAGNKTTSLPNGDEVLRASVYAKRAGLPFPKIPTKEEFKNTTKLLNSVNFYGCYDAMAPTLIYIPNMIVTNNTATYVGKFAYSHQEVNNFHDNVGAIMYSYPGNEDLPTCLACLVAVKMGHSSTQCSECMEKYCYDNADDYEKITTVVATTTTTTTTTTTEAKSTEDIVTEELEQLNEGVKTPAVACQTVVGGVVAAIS
eukprot:Pgem_evm1s16518